MKTAQDFIRMKQDGEKIAMLTAYDYPSAKQAEKAGVDVILVGDSLGMTVLGYESTVEVTLDDMIHHAKAVKRGAPDTYIIVDLPFGTYHAGTDDAVQNALRLYQASGAHAVKAEGGNIIEFAHRLYAAGVPVVGHLGLTPQSVGITGYKVQATSVEEAGNLLDTAEAFDALGIGMTVLEAIPGDLAKRVTDKLSHPTIGIGAGAATDGQVLVYHDVLKYGTNAAPKFVKQFGNFDETGIEGIKEYISGVRKNTFPDETTTYKKRVYDSDENN